MTALRLCRHPAALGVFTAIALGLGVYVVGIEPNRITVHRDTVPVIDQTKALAGLRIAVLTDLHIGAPHMDLAKLRRIVAMTNAERPDVVVILGDLVIQGVVGGRFVEAEPIAQELAALRSPLGTVAVLGNHDWYYDGPRVTKALRAAGIRVLENESLRLVRGDHRFWLAGLADAWTRKVDIRKALAGIPATARVIVLTHNPDVFPYIPDHVSLTLAGHTHGGQVCFPLVGRPIVPSRFGQRYAVGRVVEDGKTLYVGTGLGTSIIPVRFRVVPEVLLLTLQPSNI